MTVELKAYKLDRLRDELDRLVRLHSELFAKEVGLALEVKKVDKQIQRVLNQIKEVENS